MKCLVDTNIFLEIMLDQDQAQSAKEFLSRAEAHDLYISDYLSIPLDCCCFAVSSKTFFKNLLMIC